MTKSDVMSLCIADGCDRLEEPKHVRIEIGMLPSHSPLIEGAKTREAIAFFRRVIQAARQEGSGKPFVQVSPVEPTDTSVGSEPGFEIQERGEVVVDRRGLLPGEPIRKIQPDQMLRAWCVAALLMHPAQPLPPNSNRTAAICGHMHRPAVLRRLNQLPVKRSDPCWNGGQIGRVCQVGRRSKRWRHEATIPPGRGCDGSSASPLPPVWQSRSGCIAWVTAG